MVADGHGHADWRPSVEADQRVGRAQTHEVGAYVVDHAVQAAHTGQLDVDRRAWLDRLGGT